MTVWLLIAQIAIFLVTFAVAAYWIFVRYDCGGEVAGLITLSIGTAINLILSCVYSWCTITIWFSAVAIAFIGFCLGFIVEDDSLPEILFSGGGLIAGIILIAVIGTSIFGDFVHSTHEIAYVEEQKINIMASTDNGIEDTSIRGSSNLIFGTVTGTTSLTYYYSYYYQEEDGSIAIGTLQANNTKLYKLVEDEQPYVLKKTKKHKTVNWLTGLPCDEIYTGTSSYELYVPESAIPTNFTYDLN